MSKQTPINMYFRCISTPNSQSRKKTDKMTPSKSNNKRKLSLNRTTKTTPAKIKCRPISQLIANSAVMKPIECLSLLSSSEDESITQTPELKKFSNNAEAISNAGSDTDEYSWTMGSEPATPQKGTPKNKLICKSPCLSVTSNAESQDFIDEPKTPKSTSPQKKYSPNGSGLSNSLRVFLNNKNGNSPNKYNKYYSASKKRSVKKLHQSSSPCRSLGGSVRKLFRETNKIEDIEDENLQLDDKTHFFIGTIKTFLDDNSIHYLLSASELDILKKCMNLKIRESLVLICRMYWRKYKWYTKAECQNICETLNSKLLNKLVAEEILYKESGSEGVMSLDDYLQDVLKSDDVKTLCKSFKLQSKTKKSSVPLLRKFCSSTPTILQCFKNGSSNEASTGKGGNLKRVLKKMGEIVGMCYKLSELCKNTLHKIILISHLGISYEVIREKRLELLLLYVKNRQETFPSENCEIDNISCVFPTKQSLDSYMTALYLYEKFLSPETDSEKRTAIVLEAFSEYTTCSNEADIHTKTPWLRSYTAQNLYIKIVEQGIMELKKGKVESLCESAAQMMATLLQQDAHRSHHRATWADEQAKILHKYLQRPALAATILIEALESNIPDESKDILKTRARTLACQKNITLEDGVRNRLLAIADKGCISESSLPHRNVYQQPMENVTKGKVRYKIKGNNGHQVLRVEDVAIDSYKSTGEYTEGHHWEGKMITTIFFLLFWDIIYTKPKNSLGIFLCPYQMFPLDLYKSTFYSIRAKEIEERMKYIEDENIDTVVSRMVQVWSERPKSELSGVDLSLQWKHISEVSHCLGTCGLAAICARLARNYQYTHSGFPDLTVWNAATKKIKFVEVKSDTDKPSMKQLQWMQYMLQHGLQTEFCYVGTKQKS